MIKAWYRNIHVAKKSEARHKCRGTALRTASLAAALLLVACSPHAPKNETLPYYTSADFTPHWIGASANELKSIPRIAPFVLFNQNGERITEQTFAGKIYVADFIFTSCGGICPAMTSNMRQVQEAFKDDSEVLLLSHSVTPELDSIAVLKSYAERNEVISGKWHIVTGERKMIYDLARYSYFADEDLGRPRDDNDFLHTESFFLIDRQRRIRGVYNGVLPAEIARLIEDISILKKET
jgi:protein SCO1/2